MEFVRLFLLLLDGKSLSDAINYNQPHNSDGLMMLGMPYEL